MVDFEKYCTTRIYLQRWAPIQPKTSNIFPKFCARRSEKAWFFKTFTFSNISFIVIFSFFFSFFFLFFERHNGPATARPLQEGRFWKRSETKRRILRVAQKTQIRAALQELLDSLPDRMWRETMRSMCAKVISIQGSHKTGSSRLFSAFFNRISAAFPEYKYLVPSSQRSR